MIRPASGSTLPETAGLDFAYATFRQLLEIAARFLEEGRPLPAAACVQIAAAYATYNHHGAFDSDELERLIGRLAASAISAAAPARAREATPVRHVLHVLTAAKDIGGDSRFVWRWIRRDPARRHSVAVTRQSYHAIPQVLRETVAHSGGAIHVLDSANHEVFHRARSLRAIAAEVDAVFLHIYPEDIVPALAFVDASGMPPIVLVAQADHQFWAGVSAYDLFVHLRDEGIALATSRRGLTREQTALLPIPLDPVVRSVSKEEAKRQLGWPADTVVLLTIARAVKYTPIDDIGFADAAVPVINEHAGAVLLAVGPSDSGQWNRARESTGGRIVAQGQRSDTQTFHEAADIYLDSFPFSSNTSLLEAGSIGLPLVSYVPHGPGSAVLAPGTPGFKDTLIRPTSIGAYQDVLRRLIADREGREGVGADTQRSLVFMHCGEGWSRCLDELYARLEVTRAGARPHKAGTPRRAEELDLALHRFYANHVSLGGAISRFASELPYASRLAVLLRLLRVTRGFRFSLFLPERLGASMSGALRGWRRIPGAASWLGRGGDR